MAATSAVILPRDLQGKEVKVVQIKHPKTGTASDFVIDAKLYQVVRVKKTLLDRRTLFIENNSTVSIHNPNVSLLVPVDPLFILLPTLFTSSALPLDLLLTIASGDWHELPLEMARLALEPICTIDDDIVSLDRAKLDTHLRVLVDRVPVPESLKIKEIDAEYADIYQKFVSVNFISSWLSDNVHQHLRLLYDFGPLEAHAVEIIKKKTEANTVFMLSQRSEPKKRPVKGKESKAKKPTNNRSLLDMFKRK